MRLKSTCKPRKGLGLFASLTLPYGHDDGHGQVYRNGDDNAHNVDRSKKLKFSEEVKIDNPSVSTICCGMLFAGERWKGRYWTERFQRRNGIYSTGKYFAYKS